MPRISALTLDQAAPAAAQALTAVKQKIGMVPNLFATLAHAPAALGGYLALSEALGQGRLNARQREIVALASAQANRCQYCLSAHTLIGKGAGLDDDAIRQARAGGGADRLDHALAQFTQKLVQQRGVLSDAELADARGAGIDDGLMMELVANLALNLLTNYANHVADTAVDFPKVSVDA